MIPANLGEIRADLIDAGQRRSATTALAADLPVIPAEPIAKKKELLFSDDFERAELGQAWGKNVVPTFTLENGAMKGTQTRVDTPATDGKPAIVGHQAVNGVEIPTKDSIIELTDHRFCMTPP